MKTRQTEKQRFASWREKQLRKQRNLCHYCNEPMDVRRYDTHLGERLPANAATIDHVVPKALGGKTTESNLVMACRECNGEKGSTLIESIQSVRVN